MTTRIELHAIASLLRRGQSLDSLSTGLALIGMMIAVGNGLLAMTNLWFSCFGLALLMLGVMQKYWALRVALDADLLQQIADNAQSVKDSFQALDQALTALKLQPAAKAGRPWSERSGGALGLLRLQAALLATQVALALAFIMASPWLMKTG